MRGRRYNRTKKQGARTDLLSAEVAQSPTNTAAALAKVHGVSERTIKSDGKRAEAIEKLAETQPEQAQLVRDGLKRFNEVRRERRCKLTRL